MFYRNRKISLLMEIHMCLFLLSVMKIRIIHVRTGEKKKCQWPNLVKITAVSVTRVAIDKRPTIPPSPLLFFFLPLLMRRIGEDVDVKVGNSHEKSGFCPTKFVFVTLSVKIGSRYSESHATFHWKCDCATEGDRGDPHHSDMLETWYLNLFCPETIYCSKKVKTNLL